MKEDANTRAISTSIVCPDCGPAEVQAEESISVGTLEKVNYAWKVEGQAKIRHCVHSVCTRCAQVLDVAEREILLRFPSLKCPHCKKPENLVCSVEGMKEKDSSFAFSAITECKGKMCRFKRAFKKAGKSLFNISDIEIGLTGIKFKKGAA